MRERRLEDVQNGSSARDRGRIRRGRHPQTLQCRPCRTYILRLTRTPKRFVSRRTYFCEAQVKICLLLRIARNLFLGDEEDMAL